MKSCVVTENFACDPMKVWLYLTKPTLNNWCKDVSAYEESSDGMTATEKHTDGRPRSPLPAKRSPAA